MLSLALALSKTKDAAGGKPPEIFTLDIEAGTTHSEALFAAIDALLAVGQAAIDDIDVFLCQKGPGSWTGLRIGFAAVKGLAFATGKPYISVPLDIFDQISSPQNLGVSLYTGGFSASISGQICPKAASIEELEKMIAHDRTPGRARLMLTWLRAHPEALDNPDSTDSAPLYIRKGDWEAQSAPTSQAVSR
jgi:tRNA A37 threonylcarbamoyladenosine modification protein TsaB